MDKRMMWVVIAIVGLVVVFVILAGSGLLGWGWRTGTWGVMGPAMMGRWGFASLGWLGMLWMALIPLGFLILVVTGVAWLVSQLFTGAGGPSRRSSGDESQVSAREILQIRYARGEITREQYLEILADIGERRS